MYQRRIKRKAEERTFYLITNRVTGGSFIFGDVEEEYLKKLLLNGYKKADTPCFEHKFDYLKIEI